VNADASFDEAGADGPGQISRNGNANEAVMCAEPHSNPQLVLSPFPFVRSNPGELREPVAMHAKESRPQQALEIEKGKVDAESSVHRVHEVVAAACFERPYLSHLQDDDVSTSPGHDSPVGAG